MFNRYSVWFVLLILTMTGALMADELVLSNGEHLTGTIVSQNDSQVVVEHVVLGKLTIPRAKIKAINPPPPPAPAKPVKPWFKPDWLDGWKLTAGAGVSLQQDTKDAYGFQINFTAKYADKADIWNMDAGYTLSWKSQENAGGDKSYPRDANRATVGVDKQWLIPDSPWFAYANGRWNFDEFKVWLNRLQLGAGAGYYFIDESHLKISGRSGPALLQMFEGPRQSPILEASLQGDVNWKLTEKVTLTCSNQWLLNCSYFGENRNIFSLGCTVDLGDVVARGLFLNVNLSDEYDSHPEGNDPHNTLYATVSLNMSF